MKKTWKIMLTFLVALTLLLGLTACGNKDDAADKDTTLNADGTTIEEGDPDYNVEDDLVEGVLTEDMLDQMEEEEASTEEEKEKEEEEKEKKPQYNKYYIKVNRRTNVITIYTHDGNGNYNKPVKAMVCSTGRDNGTPTGKFKLSSKHRWQLMNGGVYSQYASRITGHILFHSVPYREMKNTTLITKYYNRLGTQASAGCVRLTCADALWIYSNCASGTVVEIYDGSDTGPLGKPGSINIPLDSPYGGWDPTDPDPKNPWKNAKPTIKAESFTVELGSEKVDLLSKVTATDAYGKTLQPDVSGNVDTTKAGTYSVTFTAKDSRGNSEKTTIIVTVKDTTGPEISNDLNGKKYDGELTEAAVRSYVKDHTTVKDVSGKATISNISVAIDKTAGKINCVITAEDNSGNISTLSIQMTFSVNVPDVPSTDHPSTEPDVPSTEEPSTEPDVPSTEEPSTEPDVPSTEEPSTEPDVPSTDEPASTEDVTPADVEEESTGDTTQG